MTTRLTGDKIVFEFTEEPSGSAYDLLLDVATRKCSSFSLVWREPGFDLSAIDLKRILRKQLLKESKTSHWPGTTLLDGKANVTWYRLDKRSLEVLREARSLYAWLAPKRPEDLAFYRDDESCWLASVTHEELAWVIDEVSSVRELLKFALPIQLKQTRMNPNAIY